MNIDISFIFLKLISRTILVIIHHLLSIGLAIEPFLGPCYYCLLLVAYVVDSAQLEKAVLRELASLKGPTGLKASGSLGVKAQHRQ